MSDPTQTVPVVVSPTGKPVIGQWLVIGGTLLSVLAGGIIALSAAGIGIPAWALAVAGVMSSIAGALGIASPGIRK